MGLYRLLASCSTPLTSTLKDKPLQQQPVFIPRSIMSNILRSPPGPTEWECSVRVNADTVEGKVQVPQHSTAVLEMDLDSDM